MSGERIFGSSRSAHMLCSMQVQLQDVSVTDTATVKLRPVGLFTLFGPGPSVSTDSKQCNKCCTLGAPKAK